MFYYIYLYIENCYEGNLDTQYMMGISETSPTTYYYVPGRDSYVNYVIDLSEQINPPLVNSMSWGSVEQETYQSLMDAFNTAALKLAAMGVTVLVSSGMK